MMYETYLMKYHNSEILNILENNDPNKHFSIKINFPVLFDNDPNIGNTLLRDAENALEDWDKSVTEAQRTIMAGKIDKAASSIKNNVHCRIFGLPVCPELHRTIFPQNDDDNKFLQISGTVVRMTAMKMLEFQRDYICKKCKYLVTIKAAYDLKNIIVPPKTCSNPESCTGSNIIKVEKLDSGNCKDYQEIKIQEQVAQLGFGSIPNSMWVTLEDDLVDVCKPGDNITVCGIVKRRWCNITQGKKMVIEFVLKANHIQVNNINSSLNIITPEVKDVFNNFWKKYSEAPLIGREIILKSFCPQIFRLHVVKLAIATVLAGGSQVQQDISTGNRVRSEPHLLLVGDPGTGKSQLLRFASKIIPRSVLTTGVGSTAAGLTVTAVMEDGEWQLEGGALVLADGGICCIDELNSMKEHDRTCIHEAMEQQTISVAKASIVCKLNTRCSVLAATNPKGNIDPSQPLTLNIALASPLLSRFDLIILMKDSVRMDWDRLVVDYILNSDQKNPSKFMSNDTWSVDMLQAYFTIIKKINPFLTSDATRILSSYYQIQRRTDGRNKSRTTVRLLDSLVRLSQGHARLMFHDEVDILDAVTAVLLVEIGMGDEGSILGINLEINDSFSESYYELIPLVLDKLKLQDIWDQKKLNIQHVPNICCTELEKASRDIFLNRTKSKYMSERTELNEKSQSSPVVDHNTSIRSVPTKDLIDITINQEKKICIDNLGSQTLPTNKHLHKDFSRSKGKTVIENEYIQRNNEFISKNQCEITNKEKKHWKRPSKSENVESKKKIKSSKINANPNEMDLLKLLPSMYDDFEMNLDFLDEESEQKHDINEVEIEKSNDTDVKTESLSAQMYKLSQNSKRELLKKQFSFKPQQPVKLQNTEETTNTIIAPPLRSKGCSFSQPSSSSIFESHEDCIDDVDLTI